MRKQLFQRDWKGIAFVLFFPLTLMIALYGLATRGSTATWIARSCCRQARCCLRFAMERPIASPLHFAIVFAAIAGNLYYGAARVRVYGIGPHGFFEWQDNQQRIESGFLSRTCA